MRNDGEGNHRSSDNNASRDGVALDVASEFVFDAFGVVLEGESKAGESNADEVKQGHFNGGIGVTERENSKEDGENAGIDGLGKEEGGGAFEVIDGLAAFINNTRYGVKIGI